MEKPEWHYGVGWSYGKEKFNGVPDLLKGSFYANPLFDEYLSSVQEDGSRTLYKNIWPNEDVPGIESAFKDLGNFINAVGIEVGKNLDLYIKAWEPNYETGKLERILRGSKKATGRLLHYYPVDKLKIKPENMEWCGWHNDHGTLTGLVSAMYLDWDGNEISKDKIEDPKSGLFAMNRKQEVVQIKIPRDSLAFQIGESGQIHSGGYLKATPHSVQSNPINGGISRNTFALFMNPNFEEVMNTPDGNSSKRVLKDDISVKIPTLEGRWKEGDSFEKFETKTFKQYYDFNN
jgi:isopenicillin N synthase-like dioxygenase